MADAMELQLKLAMVEREVEEKSALIESLKATVLKAVEDNNDLEEHNVTLKKVQSLLMERVAEAQRESEQYLAEKSVISTENARLFTTLKDCRRQLTSAREEIIALTECNSLLKEKIQASVGSPRARHPADRPSALEPSTPSSHPPSTSSPTARSSSSSSSPQPASSAGSSLAIVPPRDSVGSATEADPWGPRIPGHIRRTPPGGDGGSIAAAAAAAAAGAASGAVSGVVVDSISEPTPELDVADGALGKPQLPSPPRSPISSVEPDPESEPIPSDAEQLAKALADAKRKLFQQELTHRQQVETLLARLARASASPRSVVSPSAASVASAASVSSSVRSRASSASDGSAASYSVPPGMKAVHIGSGSGPYPQPTKPKHSGSSDSLWGPLVSSFLWPLTELTQAVSGSGTNRRSFDSKSHQVLQL